MASHLTHATSGTYAGQQFVNPQPLPLSAETADFSHNGDRAILASLGIFSSDRAAYRLNHTRQAAIEHFLDGAYLWLGEDRTKAHEEIAAELEAGKVDGIWAKSTKAYRLATRAHDRLTLALAQAKGYGSHVDFALGYVSELALRLA